MKALQLSNPELGVYEAGPIERMAGQPRQYGTTDEAIDAAVGAPRQYNPEMGDVDETAPLAAPGPRQYNPEMGDVDETAPAPPALKPDMSFTPEEMGIFVDPDESRRVPALSPIAMRPADQADPQAPASQGLAPKSAVAQAAQRPRSMQLPMSAASQARQAPQLAKAGYDPGPEPRSKLATAAVQLPSVIANLIQAGQKEYIPHWGVQTGRPSKLEQMQSRTAQMQQIGDQDAAARQKFAARKSWLARLQSQDQAKAAAAQRQNARQDVQDQRMATEFAQGQEDRAWSKEAQDPNSSKSQMFRSIIDKTYPQLRQQMGDEQFNQLTPATAGLIQPAIEKSKAEAAAAAQEKERVQGLEDKKTLLKYRQDIKRPTVNIGISSRGALASQGSALKALADMYGGEDKIPPGVRGRLDIIAQEPAAKRPASYKQLISQATTEGRLAEGAGMRKEKASFDEKKEYYRQSKLIREGNQEFARSDKIFKDMGLDMSKFDGQNVPGYGRIESWLHTALQGEKGQQVRQRIKQHVASLSRRMSGLAMTEAEQQRYTEIAGAAPGMSDKALIDGYLELKAGYKDADKFVRAAFKDAAAEIDANLDEAAPAAPQGVRIKSPVTGKPATFKGTAEEAKAAGYEVL